MALINTNVEFDCYAKNVEEFNGWVEKYPAENKIILTKSKNISQETSRCLPAALTWKRANHMEFHYVDGEKHVRVIYAIHYDEKSENSETISYDALSYFNGIMDVIPKDDEEEDVNLFSCPENPFSKYYNYVDERYTGYEIEHCYSLDTNSAFLAAMLRVYPKTKPWVEKFMADKEKIKAKEEITDKEKDLLKYDKIIVGWLKNPKFHRERAWKKIINDSNHAIHEMRKKIEAAGNVVLLVNTDAIKFIGEYKYDGSTKLGDFKYEWEDTSMYIKGVKSYAYVENGKWKFKQAGKCKLDEKKDRESWTLEDFTNENTDEIARIAINEKGELYEYYG